MRISLRYRSAGNLTGTSDQNTVGSRHLLFMNRGRCSLMCLGACCPQSLCKPRTLGCTGSHTDQRGAATRTWVGVYAGKYVRANERRAEVEETIVSDGPDLLRTRVHMGKKNHPSRSRLSEAATGTADVLGIGSLWTPVRKLMSVFD